MQNAQQAAYFVCQLILHLVNDSKVISKHFKINIFGHFIFGGGIR